MTYKINKFKFQDILCDKLDLLRNELKSKMSSKYFLVFDICAKSYHIYEMLANSAFSLLRLDYYDYTIIVQQTHFEYRIEIRENVIAIP